MRRTSILLITLALLGLTAVLAVAAVQRAGIAAAAGTVPRGKTTLRLVAGEAVAGLTGGGGTHLAAGWLGLRVEPAAIPTGAGPETPTVYQFDLPPSAPNPFNPRTTVHYVVPSGGGRVQLRVFDLRGRAVRTLVDGPRPAGPGSVAWNGTDDTGRAVASGVYMIRLSVGAQSAVRKVTLVK